MNPEQIATSKTEHDIFIATLRETTLPAHKRLESLPISEAIISHGLTKSTYLQYLSLMYVVIRDVEEQVFPAVAEIVPDIEARKKRHMIEADLKQLGGDTLTELHLNKPNDTITPAFAMGMMYVIEGSTLGGRVILKNVERTLRTDIRQATSYFSGYGERTGSLWKTFVDSFTNYAIVNRNKQEEMIAGANYMFSAIHDLLQKNAK